MGKKKHASAKGVPISLIEKLLTGLQISMLLIDFD
jgi:hypothetical protein